MEIVTVGRRVGGTGFGTLSYLYGYFSVVNIGYSIFLGPDMFKIVSSIAILFCLLSTTAFSESPIVKADRTIEISTLVAQMKYDRASFSAKPGEILKIILKNPGDLPHPQIVFKPANSNKNDKGRKSPNRWRFENPRQGNERQGQDQAYLFLDLINGPNQIRSMPSHPS